MFLSNISFSTRVKKLLVTLAKALPILACALTVVTASHAASPKAQLQSLIKKYQGFSANFEQVAKDPKGKVLNNSQGYLYTQKPNALLLVTESPNELFLSVVNNQVENYDPFIEQVTRSTINSKDEVPFLYLLTDSNAAWQGVTVTKDSKGCYVLSDPKLQKNYKSLNICVSGNALKSITLFEKNGNSNNYYLSQFHPRTFKASDFKIDYPSDTQVKVLP